MDGRYADDAPITTHTEDRFSRWPFAERIARVIATRADPSSLVVGIYGPWGDGKTSVLNMMEEALRSEEGVIIVGFNPWYFENEAQLIRAFFDTLSDAIGKRLTTVREDVGKFLSKYGELLSIASLSISGGAVDVNLGAGAAAVGRALSSLELEDLKKRIDALLVESKKRVVVFIDDVDRLERTEIHAILKLIKLAGGFQNTSYVLAFDQEIVSASLGERYGAGGAAAGRSFLEKIVQVPLHLPDAEPEDLRSLVFEGVDDVLSTNGIELEHEDIEAFVKHFVDGVLPAIRTPRQAGRFVNAIRFAVPLLNGEAHVVDQLLLEALRTAYPDLYVSIRDNQDTYTGREFAADARDTRTAREAATRIVNAALDKLPSDRREPARNLVKALFPRIRGLFGGMNYGVGHEDEWAGQKRIASGSYFRRYFQYAVPVRDVADADVADVIAAARSGDGRKIDAFFDNVGQRKAWSRALDKLFAHIETLEPAAAQALALGVASQAARMPHERGFLSMFMSTPSRAAILIGRLIERIDDRPLKVAVSTDVVRASTSLVFAKECLRWVKARDREPEVGLNDAEMKQVGRVLASRIKDEIVNDAEYWNHGSDLGGLLWIWKTYGDEDDLETFLTGRFEKAPTEAVRLLEAFVGRAYGMMDGLSVRTRLDRDEFNAVSALIDPEIVLVALRSAFPDVMDHPTFDRCDDLRGDRRTACLFGAFFEKVKEEQAVRATGGDGATGEAVS